MVAVRATVGKQSEVFTMKNEFWALFTLTCFLSVLCGVLLSLLIQQIL